MIEVGIRELKSRLSQHLKRLDRGESITVTRRGKPVAVILPAAGRESEEDRLRRKLLDLKARGILVQVGEGKPKGLRKPIKLIGEGPTISEMIIEDRR